MIGERVLDDLIRREGGYIDHPLDKGGPTKYGITAATLGDWRKLGCPAASVEIMALTEAEAREIYTEMYIKLPRLDLIDDPRLGELLIDCSVQFGAGEKDAARGFDATAGNEAVAWLQLALGGLKVDGKLGPVTLARYKAADKQRLFLGVMAERIKKRGRVITRDPSQSTFAKGWAIRDAEVLLL